MNYNWISKLAAQFIVFDGPDGSGKSTQVQRFVTLAKKHGLDVCHIREPGGTIIGEEIRNILLSHNHHMIDPHCEMLLYMASRTQLITESIVPALKQNRLVIADRFISSTLAYQGTAGGIPTDDILTVAQIALKNHWPDLTVIFDVDEKTAAARMNPLYDRIEAKNAQYHKRVRQGFLDQAHANPEKYIIIDATPDTDTVFDSLCHALEIWTKSRTNTQ